MHQKWFFRASSYFVTCLLATSLHAEQRAVLVDIRSSTTEQVEAMRGADGVSWWLELGDDLLLSGDAERVHAAIDSDVALRDLGVLSPGDLVLHARGCAVDVSPADLLIFPGSRYDLMLRPEASRMASLTHREPGLDASQEWLDVEPNTVISRQYRLDRPVALAADPRIENLVEKVDTGRWYADVVTLASWSRSTFSSELVTARQWIATRFQSLGLEVSEPAFTFSYSGSNHTANNVVGKIVGTSRPDDWVIVGGHYDSRQQNILDPSNSPGADDNATGCSAVLELARLFTHHRPAATMLFICYAGEEQGLQGSGAHAIGLSNAGDLAKVKLAAIMDMIGWSPNATLGADLDTTSAFLSVRNRFADAALSYVPGLAVTVSSLTCCSDHMPYINRGTPAVLSIHKSYGSYTHYHRTTDTPVNLGVHSQAIGGAIMRMNLAAVAEVAGPMDRIYADGFELAD